MNEATSFIYLSADALHGLDIAAAEVVESIERLVGDRARSLAWSAPKSAFTPPDGRYMMSTLSAADDPPFLAVKALVLNPRNPQRGLDGINATVVLLDSDTGLPMAVMDGNWVTAIRTAGLSAVAATRLAHPESRIAAFVGCGVQAHSHMRMLAELFPFKEVRAFGRGSANRDKLCESAEAIGMTAVASHTAEDAIGDADIVISSVTFSAGMQPFLDARWLKPGAFVSSTDLALPWVPEGMSAFERIIVDDLEQEAAMPKPMVDPSLVAGDLSGLVTGEVTGRGADAQPTAFVFRGVAMGDLALAALGYQKARKHSRGVSIAI